MRIPSAFKGTLLALPCLPFLTLSAVAAMPSVWARVTTRPRRMSPSGFIHRGPRESMSIFSRLR